MMKDTKKKLVSKANNFFLLLPSYETFSLRKHRKQKFDDILLHSLNNFRANIIDEEERRARADTKAHRADNAIFKHFKTQNAYLTSHDNFPL